MSYNMLCIILHGELYKVLGLYIDTMVDLKSEAIMEMENFICPISSKIQPFAFQVQATFFYLAGKSTFVKFRSNSSFNQQTILMSHQCKL